MPPFPTIRARCLPHLGFEAFFGLAVLAVTAQFTPHGDQAFLWTGAIVIVIFLLTRGACGGRGLARFGRVSATLGLLSLIVIRLSDASSVATQLVPEGLLAVAVLAACWKWLSERTGFFRRTRERVLILGTGGTARELCSWLADFSPEAHTVVGFIDEDPERIGQPVAAGVRVVTDPAGLVRFASEEIDRVIVALDEKRGKLPVRQLMELRVNGVEIEPASSFLERVGGRISVEHVLPSMLIYSGGFHRSRAGATVKRAVDVAIAVTLLALNLPLMMLAALAIRLEDGGPILFRQVRVGRRGLQFRLLKFRSMVQGAERESGPVWTATDDPRVTRVGRVIRTLRIDELPQLFNVLRGEMSLVGPRPERPEFVDNFERDVPLYGLRHRVPPGITGWAQVCYGYGADEDGALEKLRYDFYYVKHGGILFDFVILLRTVGVVLTGAGAR